MLSRTADSLYWMARYIERAENLARMLEVTHRTSLMASATELEFDPWWQLIVLTETEELFDKKYDVKTAKPNDYIQFLAFDDENPSSVHSCLYWARENARTLRGVISSEMWESINSTWLEFRAMNKHKLVNQAFGDFCDWVKKQSHLFRGVTLGTALQDEGFIFLRLGTFVERSDNTARILMIKYNESPDLSGDYYYWGSVLRSVTAFDAYRRVYRDKITPKRVAELLILRADLPRSLHGCFDAIYHLFDQLPTARMSESARLAGELHAMLHYGLIDKFIDAGLVDFATTFIKYNNELSSQISKDFLFYQVEEVA